MDFNSKYKSSEIEEILDSVGGKQDKVSGKGLSTEDFTSALKTKLEGLSNYDDTELSEALSTLRNDFDELVSGDTTNAIKTFNEVIAFLDGIQDSQDLTSIIASIEQQIARKMDKVTLAKVATSGSYNDLTNKPTIPAEQVNADWNATSGKAQILNKPTIPSAVTESTVSGWGFTKNTGTYSKPSTGIPKTDLASAVQTSLGKADTALQSYTEKYTGTVTGVKINGTTKNPSNGVVDLGTIITSHQTLKTINGESILGEGDLTIESGNSENIYYLSSEEDSGVVTAEEYEKIKKCNTLVLQLFQNGNIVFSQSFISKIDDTILGEDGKISFLSTFSAGNGVQYNTIMFGLNEDGSATWNILDGDAYSFKTINGESILGEGDIVISGGGSSSGSGAYAEVNHGTSDTTFTLTPNTFHVWDEVSALTLTTGSETEGVANEFLFQFTSGSEATSLTLPDDIKWTEELTIEPNMIYQVSILKGLASVLEFSNKGLFPITITITESVYADVYSYFMTNYSLPDSEKPSGAITISEQITIEDSDNSVSGIVIKASIGLTNRLFLFTENSINNYYAVYITEDGYCGTYFYD